MRCRPIPMICAIASLWSLGGCLGTSGPPPGSDAGYTYVPDLAIACTTNNDGVLSRGEFPLVVGGSARYLQNPEDTVAAVDPVGQQTDQGPAWDFTSTAGEAIDFPIESVTGAWYASSFPDATYATYTDPFNKILGVFKLTDDALQLMGYASEAANQTLLVYDQPIDTIRFPLQLGDGWVETGHIVNGVYNGLPVAETDTYQIDVDAKGVVVLPYLQVSNVLRIRVMLDQALPGGSTTQTIQLLYFRECVGELGRMVSQPNETNPNFTMASTFRRLALE